MTLAGKIALVTGASRGLGAAIAKALAEQGAIVVGTATTAEGAEKISQVLAATKGKGMVLNVADQASIEACLKQITDELGDIDILVNNAGITRDNLLLRMKQEDWDETLNTNLTSVYRLIKATIRGMMKKKFGRIINISSISGIIGNPGQANYAASKAGMIGLAKSIALEFASRNITVNTIAPGFIETDMTDKLSEAQKQQLLTQIPMGSIGKPEDIASAVVFLASSDYITGETLHINGGMYMS